MDIEKVLYNICYYDIRNPDNILNEIDKEDLEFYKKTQCFCDNCFYRRHQLADYILKLLNYE